MPEDSNEDSALRGSSLKDMEESKNKDWEEMTDEEKIEALEENET